jgi:hypothetical protein
LGSLNPYQRTNDKGERERVCTGPSHETPTWLPETHKYFYFSRVDGIVNSRCRLCHLYGRVKDLTGEPHGYVRIEDVHQYFVEATNRVGAEEFARRARVSSNTIYAILHRHNKYITKATFRKCMLELVSIRRKDEVRHRDSIKRGVTVRGESEKKVILRNDLNKPHGDDYAEQRKQNRRKHAA